MNHSRLMRFSLLVLVVTTGFYVVDNLFLILTRDGIVMWVTRTTGIDGEVGYWINRLVRFFMYLGLFGFFSSYRHRR